MLEYSFCLRSCDIQLEILLIYSIHNKKIAHMFNTHMSYVELCIILNKIIAERRLLTSYEVQ